ncbi:MAG: imidazole glycerol phosphate synthase subunit HisH [Acutalibacteraceae bacterium]
MIAIIDYGAGNLQSVANALDFIGCEYTITSNKDVLLSADGAILPGVGSFGDAMNCMINNNLKNAVIDFINSGKPFLGICLGLQLLFGKSEESPESTGLDILQGKVRLIPKDNGLKIPHMGWNNLKILKHDGIFKGIKGEPYVYFVHSYYLKADNPDIVSSQTYYGVDIDASVQYKNISAVQFHPEKSGKVGLKMLQNFADMAMGGNI